MEARERCRGKLPIWASDAPRRTILVAKLCRGIVKPMTRAGGFNPVFPNRLRQNVVEHLCVGKGCMRLARADEQRARSTHPTLAKVAGDGFDRPQANPASSSMA